MRTSRMRLNEQELVGLNKFRNADLKLGIDFTEDQVYGYRYIEISETEPRIIKGFSERIEQIMHDTVYRGDTESNEHVDYVRIFSKEDFDAAWTEQCSKMAMFPSTEKEHLENKERLIDTLKKRNKRNAVATSAAGKPDYDTTLVDDDLMKEIEEGDIENLTENEEFLDDMPDDIKQEIAEELSKEE